jgi:hypothetical protein
MKYKMEMPEHAFRRVPITLFTKSGAKPLFNVHPWSAAYGTVEEIRIANHVGSRTRINNERSRKELHTMQSHIHVLDAHVQAVTTRRLLEARRAEMIRLAGLRPGNMLTRLVSRIRTATGRALVSTGQRLQREPVTAATRDLEALDVTSTKTMPS